MTHFCNGQSSGFIEGGLEGKGGNSITLQNYRNIESAYAKEFMRAAEGNEAFGSQVTYIQQVLNYHLNKSTLFITRMAFCAA